MTHDGIGSGHVSRSLRGVTVALMILGVAGTEVRGQIELRGARTAHAGSQPLSGLATGDLDGDGVVDLVFSRADRKVGSLVGNGRGRFFSGGPNRDTIDQPGPVVLEDFDGDGHLDAAVAIPGFVHNSFSVEIYLGDGLGGLVPERSVLPGLATDLAGGDLDGDGHVDLVVAANLGASFAVLLGDGTGDFGEPVFFPRSLNPIAVEVLHLDGDGVLDVALLDGAGVTVYLGDGGGGLSEAETITWSSSGLTRSFAFAPLVGDGNLDLAVLTSSQILLYEGDGTGAFDPAGSVSTLSTAFAIGDLDGDGHRDLACSGQSLEILYADGSGGFLPARRLGGGGGSLLVEIADVDGDGRLDVVAGNQVSGALHVFLREASGSRTWVAASVHVGVTERPASLDAGDLDEDGHLDLVVVSERGNAVVRGVTVLFGNGNGGFPGLQKHHAGARNNSVVVEHLDGDGHLDVAVTNHSDETVTVFAGDGAGGLTVTQTLTAGAFPGFLVAEDLSGDGVPDLVLSNSGDDTVSAYINDGTGVFSPEITTATGADQPRGLAVGDFDEDGHADLAVAHIGLFRSTILLGDGAGGFTDAGFVEVQSQPDQSVAADLDGDGHQDLVVVSTGFSAFGGGVTLWYGTGLGTFENRLDLGAGRSPGGVAVADLNEDGDLDLAVTAKGSGAVTVLLSNGGRDFFDAGAFAVGSFPTDLVLGDFDEDGHLDAAACNQEGDSVAVLDNLTFDPVVVRRGGVAARSGTVADVLRVNGSSGEGVERIVSLTPTDSFELFLDTVPARATTRFALWVWVGEPEGSTVKPLPSLAGTLGLPLPLHAPCGPLPARTANGIGFEARLGTSDWPVPFDRAPAVLARRPGGVGRAGRFYAQALVLDPEAANRVATATNGIVIDVE